MSKISAPMATATTMTTSVMPWSTRSRVRTGAAWKTTPPAGDAGRHAGSVVAIR